MSVQILTPPNTDNLASNTPTIFLAGPIQGAPHWQTEAAVLISKLQGNTSELRIANPRRGRMTSDFDYKVQVDWEKNYLKKAAKNGVIIFYFAAQDPNEPYEEGRAYAQTSRIEIGRIFGWHDKGLNLKIVIGFDPSYAGGSQRYIEEMAKEKDWVVYNSLDAVCKQACTLLES